MIITTFQNGQTLTSTALVPNDMVAIFQVLATQLLGVTSNLLLNCQLQQNSNNISTALGPNVFAGFIVKGNGIPDGTTVVTVNAANQSLLLTLSNAVTVSGLIQLAFFDPAADTRVRLSWQTQGAPAFDITEDVLFIRCTEEPTPYNLIRNESLSATDTDVIKTRTYSRQWGVFLRARGPNSFASIALIKSMLLDDFAHGTLAASNLYLIPEMGTPIRNPELFEGQWWEQVDLNICCLEQVTETINIPKVQSVELIGEINSGTVFDVTVRN